MVFLDNVQDLESAAMCLKAGDGSACIKINLDAVENNIKIIRDISSVNTEVIAVTKGNAYASGVVPVVETALAAGATHVGVATVSEGVFLRQANVKAPIIVLGNLIEEELDNVLLYELMPSVCWDKALIGQPKEKLKYPNGNRLQVNVNLDTGMSRYGVQPKNLPALINFLDDQEIEVYSIYTQFFSSICNVLSNEEQLKIFMSATQSYVGRGIRRHVAATVGLVQNLGMDLDFVRPGGGVVGLCTDNDVKGVKQFSQYGFQPIFSVIAKPTFYKLLEAGRTVGYDGTYKTNEKEWIANIAVGWSDGYPRKLSEGFGFVKRIRTGEICPVVGRVSMDSIVIRLTSAPTDEDLFQVISDDFHDKTSAVGISRRIGSAVYEVQGNWSTRVPRVFVRNRKVVKLMKPLGILC